MDNLTTDNLTSATYQVRDGKATIYAVGEWDGGQIQIEFKAPWSNGPWIADVRYAYTADTVEVIEVGDAASIRAVFSGGSDSEDVAFEVTT